jgi:hypothetical protein
VGFVPPPPNRNTLLTRVVVTVANVEETIMFKLLKGNQQDEEALLRRAMGQLYRNRPAREMLRERLQGRDITQMREEDIYAMVRDVVRSLQASGVLS